MAFQIPGGFYLSLDGSDGCGKTTQYDMLKNRLISDGLDIITMREPGSTGLGNRIREIVLHDESVSYSIDVEMMLYQVARRDNFEKNVLPALKEGKLVLADRSFDATLAYQGYGGGVDKEGINWLSNYATQGRSPDLSFILDIEAEKGLERISGESPDKIESRPLEFHERVAEGFREIARDNKERCVLVPYLDGKIQETHDELYRITKERIISKLG